MTNGRTVTMDDRCVPIPHFARLIASLGAVLALCLAAAGPARADVVGRLRIIVKNADDEKPISGVKVTLKDTANVRPNITLTTDATGTVTSPQLENHAWQVTVEPDPVQFKSDSRTVTVVADATTDVEFLLEPQKETVIRVTGQQNPLQTTQTTSSTKHDQTFIQKTALTGANPQAFNATLKANPGFVSDSVNQNHPRGEHSATQLQLDGVQIPGALQGRIAQI